jgi:hypothetical protein
VYGEQGLSRSSRLSPSQQVRPGRALRNTANYEQSTSYTSDSPLTANQTTQPHSVPRSTLLSRYCRFGYMEAFSLFTTKVRLSFECLLCKSGHSRTLESQICDVIRLVMLCFVFVSGPLPCEMYLTYTMYTVAQSDCVSLQNPLSFTTPSLKASKKKNLRRQQERESNGRFSHILHVFCSNRHLVFVRKTAGPPE